MWVWHACLSSLTARCNPTSWGDVAEMFGVITVAVLAPFGLGLLAEWLDSLF